MEEVAKRKAKAEEKTQKPSIYSLEMNDLENWLVEHGDKKFRAKQIFDWLYVKRVTDFDDMSNLSKGLREQL
ncbi:23S rRNA (adenine(2503)-C(2))-methyltransferase RlmN, partial [Priestia megaterium]